MTDFTFTADTASADTLLADIAERVQSGVSVWGDELVAYMAGQTEATFDALAYAGSFRNVTWPPFARTPSPARGGAAARLLDFTGALKFAALSAGGIADDGVSWTVALPYAARQQAMRPFLFFDTPTDADAASAIIANFLGDDA